MTVFTLSQSEKEARLLPELVELTEHHRARSPEYARLLSAIGHQPGHPYRTLTDLPWLPVRLFKNHALKSIEEADIFKVLTSSGTTGDVSRIFLDKEAAAVHRRCSPPLCKR